MAWTEAELAYAAGIVDGEGHIAIHRRYGPPSKRHQTRRLFHRPYVEVSSTDRCLVEWLNERWPGAIYTYQRNGQKDHTRPLHRWQISCSKAAEFIAFIRPYLVIKGNQADLLIDYQSTVGPVGTYRLSEGVVDKREELRTELMALTKRGR